MAGNPAGADLRSLWGHHASLQADQRPDGLHLPSSQRHKRRLNGEARRCKRRHRSNPGIQRAQKGAQDFDCCCCEVEAAHNFFELLATNLAPFGCVSHPSADPGSSGLRHSFLRLVVLDLLAAHCGRCRCRHRPMPTRMGGCYHRCCTSGTGTGTDTGCCCCAVCLC